VRFFIDTPDSSDHHEPTPLGELLSPRRIPCDGSARSTLSILKNQGSVPFGHFRLNNTLTKTPLPPQDNSVSQDHCAPVVGLVGGIGSGKSALASWVSHHAPIEVLDGDLLGHHALKDPTLARLVLDRFPQARSSDDTNSANSDHQISRPALAGIVFGDDRESLSARSDLETIVHPFIRRRLQDLIHEHRGRSDCEGILVDAAVLLEAGWHDLCDHVVFVDVPEALRLSRVTETRDWTRTDYLARQSSQWPPERKQDAADTSLDNSGSLEDSGPRLLSLVHSLRGKTSASCP